jgi:hypothetical protein
MSNKKHLDRLFQERFKDFEGTPDDAVWDAIHETLHGKNKKRRIIPLWWRIGGIAAGLVLLFTIGNVLLNTNSTATPDVNSIVDIKDAIKTENGTSPEAINPSSTNESSNSQVATSKGETLENNSKEEHELIDATRSENKLIKNTSSSQQVVNSNNRNNATSNNSSNTSYIKNKTSKVAANTSDKLNGSKIIKKERVIGTESLANNKEASQVDKNASENQSKPNTIDKSKADKLIKNNQKNPSEAVVKIDATQTKVDSIATQVDKAIEDKPSIFDELNKEDDKVADEDSNIDRWNVMPNIAPVYFNSLGKGSSIHSQFRNNDKSGQVNMSYGIAASYAITNKLSVRSGVNKVNVGYNTNDVIIYQGLEASLGGAGRSIETINYTDDAQAITVVTAANLEFSQVPDVVNNAIDASLDQNLGFVEVPLELAYKISDKKLGISVIGGMSALFLSNNEISSTLNGNRTLLGEANNIRTTSFSANFGLGMDYKLSEKFNINLEPVFKYQMNTFESKSGNFNPFIIGIYTGVSFKF